MFSDDLTVSWGWMVDDLYIQKDLPVVQGIEFTELDKNISIIQILHLENLVLILTIRGRVM